MADVIGSAELEIRASTRRLRSDMARAEREAAAELKKVERAARHAQHELKRAFGDAGHSEFERSMWIIRNASQHTEQEVRGAADRVARDLSARYNQLGTDIGQTLRRMSFAAQLAFGAITVYALKLATDAGEIESAFDVAFGAAADSARDFADVLGDRVGRDAVELREKMTRLQLVLTGTGVAAQQAAELVQALTVAGVDAGSLFNTSDAEAMQKIISGLTGETEPLKAFGVVVSEAAVQAELLRLGFKGNASEASEAAKSIARANLILEGLSVAQGDAERTADSAANTTRRMTAEFNKAARDLGQQLIPAMTQLFGAATDVLEAFNDLPGGVQVAGLAFLGLIAAGGPIAGLLAGLGRVIVLARETRLALIAAGAAGAGAGASAGAGAAGAGLAIAARALPGVGAGAAVLSLGGDTQQGPIDPDQLVAARQRDLDYVRDRGMSPEMVARAERGVREAREFRAQQNARLEQQAADAVTAGAADAPDTTVPGGFTLPPELQTATSNGTQRRGSRGRSEEDIAAARARLELENDIAVARARGDQTAAQALEEQLQLVTLTDQYRRLGYSDAESQALAQIARINEATSAQEVFNALTEQKLKQEEQYQEALERSAIIEQDRLTHEIELAKLAGDETAYRALIREEAVRARINQLLADKIVATREEASLIANTEADARDAAEVRGRFREEFRSAFSEGIRAAIDGDLGGFFEGLADRFTDRLLENLADDLFDILAQAASGLGGGSSGGGTGNWLTAAASLFGFGGGKASGGPVKAGMAYTVGEQGPETLLMPSNGFVIPSGGLSGAAGGRQTVHVIVDSRDEKFRAFIQETTGPAIAASHQSAVSTAEGQVAGRMAESQRRAWR